MKNDDQTFNTFGRIKIPATLYESLKLGECVIFAGAGVSMGPPANYPNFQDLVRKIANGSIPTDLRNKPFDHILGRLEDRGLLVHELARDILSDASSSPNEIHKDILRLFHNQRVRIVTTNFDQHFTNAANEIGLGSLPIYSSPALPMGNSFDGIVHLHGSTFQNAKSLILTDKDFGRAYLTEAWAARFLLQVYSKYTVVFIGYSHNDTIVTYLARGFGAPNKALYAITPPGNAEKWARLGIEAIEYPIGKKKNDHSELQRSIHRLAKNLGQRLLDNCSHIECIAKSTPPKTGIEDDGFLVRSLNDRILTSVFCQHATGAMWLYWFHEKQLLDECLSLTIGETRHEMVLLTRWVCEKLLLHGEKGLALLRDWKGKLGNAFVEEMWWSISHADQEIAPTIGKWAVILLNSQSLSQHRIWQMRQVLHKFGDLGQWAACKLLFDCLVSPLVSLRKAWTLDEDSSDLTSIEFDITGDTHDLDSFYCDYIVPNISQWAYHLVQTIPRHLSAVDICDHAFAGEERVLSPWSIRRKAIEQHKQDRYRKGHDIPIDSLRDSVAYFARTNRTFLRGLIAGWDKCQNSILRRMAVFATGQLYYKSSPNAVLNYVIEKQALADFELHHETFQAVRISFPAASRDLQGKFCNHARSLYNKKNTRFDQRSYSYYNLLTWLTGSFDSPPDWLQRRLSRFQSQHTDFAPREHPDLLSWSSEMGWGEEIEYDLEELSKMQTAKLARFIFNAALRDKFHSPYSTARKIATSYPQKGLSLLLAIGKRTRHIEIIDSMIAAILTGLANASELDSIWGTVLENLARINGCKRFPMAVIEFAKNIVDKEDNTILENLGDDLVQICIESVNNINKEHSASALIDGDPFESAINSRAGDLAVILVHVAYNQPRNKPKINKTSEQLLLEIIRMKGRHGLYARIRLMEHAAWIHQLRPVWVEARLMPLLDPSHRKGDIRLWHGIFHSRKRTKGFLRALDRQVQIPIQHLDGELRAIRHDYLGLLAYRSAIQQRASYCNKIVPKMLAYCDSDIRSDFYSEVEDIYSHSGNDIPDKSWSKWLKQHIYWRRHGHPVPLAAIESFALISCILHLRKHFSDGVTELVKCPVPNDKHSRFLHNVENLAPWKKEPLSVLNLIAWFFSKEVPHLYVMQEELNMLEYCISRCPDEPVVDDVCNGLAMSGYLDANNLLTLIKNESITVCPAEKRVK